MVSSDCHITIYHLLPILFFSFYYLSDFNQHRPPNGSSLYSDPTKGDSSLKGKNQAGRDAWLRFKHCVILNKQHRFNDDTPDGAKLWDAVKVLMSETPYKVNTKNPDRCELRAAATKLCDDLNACAITPEQLNQLMQSAPPRVVVTRNVLRNPLNLCLYKHHASFNKKRLITWFAHDVAVCGRQKARLSPMLANLVRNLSPDHAFGIPGQQFFYEGILYRMTENVYPQVRMH